MVQALPAGKSVEAYLAGTYAADTTVSETFSVPTLTATTKVIAAVEARRQSDGSAYVGKATINPDGSVSVSASRRQGFTETALGNVISTSTHIAAGQQIAMDMEVTGAATVQVRVYPAGSAAPDWQYVFTDTSPGILANGGQVGVWDYVSGSSSATTVDVNRFGAWSMAPVRDTSKRGTGVGQAAYPLPASALFVNPNTGSDNAPGTQAAPFKTVAHAVAVAASGSTIVLRAGVYHEKVTISTPNLTIQSYPKEAVWFDGTASVPSWTASGNVWVAPWTTQFGHSSSFTSTDTTSPGTGAWNFVNPAYPMAAWPDQAFIDGNQLTQVAANPTAGQFAVDYTAKTLTIGSNPGGHTVTADTLNQAFFVTGSGDTLEGFGVRDYATALSDIGTIVMQGAGDAAHNLDIENSATQAISFQGANQIGDQLTINNPGMTGIHSNGASNLVISNSVINGDNWEHFNPAPSAAGIKLTRSTNVTVTNNTVDNSYFDTVGIWMDENVIGLNIVGNSVNNDGTGSRAGIQVELSGSGLSGPGSSGVIADNDLSQNMRGLFISDSGHLDVYNNNFGSNGTASIYMTQDNRYLPGDGTAGPNVQPSDANPWIDENVAINNNMFAYNGGPYGLALYALDQQTNRPASQMITSVNGNAFHTKTSASDGMVAWGQKDNTTATRYDTPAALDAGLNQTWNNLQVPDQPSLAVMPAEVEWQTNALALPANVATAIGQATGTAHIGIF